MFDLVAMLLDTSSFPARWHCGDWTPVHGWTHIVADTAIAVAYFSIPASIASFMRRRPDAQFPRIGWLFAAFILCCGIGHLIEATIFWQPWYRLSALSKIMTAAVSLMTALVVWRVMPVAMKLPGITRLNASLEREIEERRRAEADLRTREAEFRAIAEALPQIVFVADSAGGSLYVNPYFTEFTGLSNEEAMGDGWLRAVHPDDRDAIGPAWKAAVQSGLPWEREYRFIRADGIAHTFMARGRPVTDESGAAVRWVGFCADITERKQAEARQRALDRELQQSQKLESLGVLAGGIAHDFNNLLTGIRGNASLMRYGLPPGAPDLELVDEIEAASNRAAELCRQMLAYAGRGRFSLEPLAVSAAVGEIAALLRASVSKNATVDLDLADDRTRVEADATQLRQVVMNLIMNASDALGDAGGAIRVQSRSRTIDADALPRVVGTASLAPGRYASIVVEDDGCGMEPDVQARMFDPFFTTRADGRGLGLAAALGIVRGHHGALSVRSTPGVGTRIEVLLPVSEHAAHASPAPDPPARWTGHGRALVVDDEPAVRAIAARTLRRAGFTVDEAEDGEDALQRFGDRAGDYAVAVVDLTMPRLDGEQTFRALRRRAPRLPVLLMSGFDRDDALARFGDGEAPAFIEKPFDLGSLVAAIRPLLAQAPEASDTPDG